MKRQTDSLLPREHDFMATRDLLSDSIIPFRNQNDGLAAAISDATSLKDFEPTLTQQNLASETDINFILDKFTQTGQLPQNSNTPKWGDFTDVSDFHQSMNTVLHAQEMFAALPAQLRARFGNDPGAYVEFVLDPANRDEVLRLGLATDPLEAAPPNVAPKAAKGSEEPEAPKPSKNAPSGASKGDKGD